MQENIDGATTNKAPSYLRAQHVSMKLILSKCDNTAAASLKIVKCKTHIYVIAYYKGNIFTLAATLVEV